MSENNPNASGVNPFGQQPSADPFGRSAGDATGPSAASAGQGLPSYPAAAGASADPFGQQAAAGYQQPANAAYPAADSYGAGAYPAYPAQNAFAEPPLDQPWYGIDIVNATKRFFLKYATFSGRASRGEYWWAFAAIMVMSVVASLLGIIPILGTIVSVVFGLGIIIPSIAISVRRLHDSNLSGWFFLIPAVLSAIASMIAGAGFGPLVMKIVEDPQAVDNMTDAEMTEMFMPVLGGVLGASLVGLVGMIVWIVLMVRKSNPAGVRFDKNPAQGTYGM